ncbi:MAG: glycosyltransferase, partial [Xanthomonadales bacterium]|nr:glycosyltransferase [Xanthomonadales bacterium]
MISCSIVIVNFNTGELLKDCVASAITNDFVNRIVVVDNYSTDNSMELLMDSEKLTKIYRDINPGFASSCNLGAEKAKTEFLLFLNPDCILLDKETISTLINNLQQNANSAIAGCLILNPDGSEQRAARRRLPTFWRAIKTYSRVEKLAYLCSCFAGVNLSHQKMPNSVHAVEAISG